MTTTTKEIQQEKIQPINEIIKNGMIEMEQIPERDHDFFYLDDANQNKSTMAKHLKRRITPYTSTRVKVRNFLSNIAYSGVKSDNFFDNNFVFDIITLLTKNINPFLLERKIIDLKNRDIIYMFCDECVEKTFYRDICENENFIYLNGKNVLYDKTAQIVMNYLGKDWVKILQTLYVSEDVFRKT